MQNILDKVKPLQKNLVPQTVSEFIVLQMAIKAGDPFLFRPYTKVVETTSLAHCIELFRQKQKLPF